ncbi:MAG TPA: SIS domain-containing protein [Micromonosporaceae bacterium]|jgi:D-sedoheptulose 7-phosphate isomerase|nr:SIS domain-containing protein [Micromonosporaceae bacterium]
MRGDPTALLEAHVEALGAALTPFRASAARLARLGRELAWVLGSGGRLLVAGNGGSAEQAQHVAAELVGKLRDDRPPLSAIALCTDRAVVTALSNDYGYDDLFARQVRAHGRRGDVLLLLSTSGHSRNLLAAAAAGADAGLRCWAFTGPTPNPLADGCAEVLAVSCADGQVVQELHLVGLHVLCDYVDRELPQVTGWPQARVDAAGAPLGGGRSNGGRP